MKKIWALLPVAVFMAISPFIAKIGIPNSACVLILTLGFPLSILLSYFLFGKHDIKPAIFGVAFSVLLICGSVCILYFLRSGEFVAPDFSLYHVCSVAALSLLAAVGEEFIFRGALLGLLVKYCNKFPLPLLLVVQASLFAASHLVEDKSISFFAVTFSSGIFLGWAAQAAKSLWFSIGFHFGWDFAVIFLTGYDSKIFGYLQGPIIFDSAYASANNFVSLLALAIGALGTMKFFQQTSKNQRSISQAR